MKGNFLLYVVKVRNLNTERLYSFESDFVEFVENVDMILPVIYLWKN